MSSERGLVKVVGTGASLLDVAAGLVARGIRPADLQVHRPTLEDVFLSITGHPVEE